MLGFSSGVFGLYEMPDCTAIHTLSVGQAGIGTCDVSTTGDWLAFGCARLGQVGYGAIGPKAKLEARPHTRFSCRFLL